MSGVDPEFLALPLTALADAALTRARELGASYAALRVVSLHGHYLSLQDLEVESSATSVDRGLAVRVVHDGCWGFAAGLALTADEAARLAERAVAVAVASRPVSTERVELAPEPVYAGVTWSSPYEVDPFAVPDGEKVATLVDLSERLAAGDGVSATHASVQSARESVFYADSSGTSTTQTRVRIHPVLSAVAVDRAPGRVRVDADAGAAGGRGLGVRPRPVDGAGGRGRRSCRSCCARRSRRRRCGRGSTTWSSTGRTCG